MVSVIFNYSRIILNLARASQSYVKGVYKNKKPNIFLTMLAVYIILANILFFTGKVFADWARYTIFQ